MCVCVCVCVCVYIKASCKKFLLSSIKVYNLYADPYINYELTLVPILYVVI